MNKATKNLNQINLLTGLSDGLVLPFACSFFIALGFNTSQGSLIIYTGIFTLILATALAVARFLGEQAEIEHNHPDLSAQHRKDELQKMQQLGIDPEIMEDMQSEITAEQNQWLQEMNYNEMGWSEADKSRAWKAAVSLWLGYVIGAVFSLLPLLFLFQNTQYRTLSLLWVLVCSVKFGWLKGKLLQQGKYLRYVLLQVGKLIALVLCAYAVNWLYTQFQTKMG